MYGMGSIPRYQCGIIIRLQNVRNATSVEKRHFSRYLKVTIPQMANIQSCKQVSNVGRVPIATFRWDFGNYSMTHANS